MGATTMGDKAQAQARPMFEPHPDGRRPEPPPRAAGGQERVALRAALYLAGGLLLAAAIVSSMSGGGLAYYSQGCLAMSLICLAGLAASSR